MKRYSLLDKLLHHLVLNIRVVPSLISEFEEFFFKTDIHSIKVKQPVFITSLPRSGTTLILRLLNQTGLFATSLYRDMPFVMAPIFWQKFSQKFGSKLNGVERDHADGVIISSDSPEAFEEIFWKYQFPEFYDKNAFASNYFSLKEVRSIKDKFISHIRKTKLIRQNELLNTSPKELRYLSKNNKNIIRIELLLNIFNQPTIIVPFRNPLEQSASLLFQHKRFLELQQKEPFILKYMDFLGHHEFGMGLKPINFNGWYDNTSYQPKDLNFWLEYWATSYQSLVKHKKNVVFISYDNLVSNPENQLKSLANQLKINDDTLLNLSNNIRQPTAYNKGDFDFDTALLNDADDIYSTLTEISI